MPDIFTASQQKTQVEPVREIHSSTLPHDERLSTSLPASNKGSTPGLFTSYRPFPIGIKFIN